MSQIWLDVTTILSWQRAAVGIVRVEAECASHALAVANVRVRFCRFDGRAGYQPVDSSDVRAALDRIRGRQTEVTDKSTGEQRVKAHVRRLIELLPGKLQTSALEFARAHTEAYTSLADSYRELRRAIVLLRPNRSVSEKTGAPQAKGQAVERRVAPFGSDDVYVSLGLDWEHKNLPYLYDQKRKIGFRVLWLCYDIIPVKFPHLCAGELSGKFARYFADVAWCADQILCISECSRSDLRELLIELGTPVPSLSLVKLGCQLRVPAFHPVADDVAPVLRQRYILYVSTIEPRKNHETLYRAYVRLIEQGEKDLPLLVFVGMRVGNVGDFLRIVRFDPRTKQMIRILNHVSDSDLSQLYENSLFTVYPSLYEGWGLPVAESLAAGKFCLASHAASIQELARDLIEYLDPWDVPSWSERLAWYIKHPDELAKKEERIRREYKATSWSETASCVLNSAMSLPDRTSWVRERPTDFGVPEGGNA